MSLPLRARTLLLSVMSLSIASAAEAPSFIPLPAKVELKGGQFKLDQKTSIQTSAALKNEADWLASRLRTTSNFPVKISPSAGNIQLSVDPALKPEGYVLDISSDKVSIRGGSPAGVFYACVTFLQTLPAEVFGTQPAADAQWSAAGIHVEDAPSTTWRGMHLDSSRHFQPKAFIFKFIDAMAAQKLNRMHWHLVDSEAWRLEIKKYPKLVTVHEKFPAYYPEEIPTNPTFRAKYRYGKFHGGGFYSQADVKEIVDYAQKRHVTIIPEIEFPGHTMAALTAYPEFGTTGKKPETVSNISPDLFGVHPEAIQFLKDVLDETMALFPSPWIHFGGDEAPKGQWQKDPYVQKRIDELKLRVTGGAHNASEDALQGWLFNQLADHIAKKGRKAVGWEEIMHNGNLGKLDKNAVIMPWLSTKNAIDSANAGRGVVHTAVSPFYLDSYQVNDKCEPSALYNGPNTVQQIHQYNLFPEGLTEEGKKSVLGAQAQLWTELMPDTDNIEYQAYPRACALAELTWTAPELRKDANGFMNRLTRHGKRLTALGLNHRRTTPAAKLAWSADFLESNFPWLVNLSATTFEKNREIIVTFKYESGVNALKIKSVELLADEQVVAKDSNEGSAGASEASRSFRLKLPDGASIERVSLKVNAKGDGGSDSNGTVTISHP